MKQSTFRCVSTLLLALGLAYAQEPDGGYTPEVESDGVLSVVEDLPEPGNSEGLYRLLLASTLGCSAPTYHS